MQYYSIGRTYLKLVSIVAWLSIALSIVGFLITFFASMGQYGGGATMLASFGTMIAGVVAGLVTLAVVQFGHAVFDNSIANQKSAQKLEAVLNEFSLQGSTSSKRTFGSIPEEEQVTTYHQSKAGDSEIFFKEGQYWYDGKGFASKVEALQYKRSNNLNST